MDKVMIDIILTCTKKEEIVFLIGIIDELMEKQLNSQVERLRKKISFLPFEMLELELDVLKTKSLKDLNEEELDKWIDCLLSHIRNNIHLIEQLKACMIKVSQSSNHTINTLVMDEEFVIEMQHIVDYMSRIRNTRIPYRNADILFRQFVFLLVSEQKNKIKTKLIEIIKN